MIYVQQQNKAYPKGQRRFRTKSLVAKFKSLDPTVRAQYIQQFQAQQAVKVLDATNPASSSSLSAVEPPLPLTPWDMGEPNAFPLSVSKLSLFRERVAPNLADHAAQWREKCNGIPPPEKNESVGYWLLEID